MELEYLKKLKNIIDKNNDTYILLGADYCIYCQKAIKLFKKKNKNFIYLKVDKNLELFFKILFQLSKKNKSYQIVQSHNTIPVIFYKKKFIGGFSDLQKVL